jgi:tungstate transport system ATP-binding protein
VLATRSRVLPLELSDVCFRVGRDRLLDGVSARIEAGSRTVILGPNGSGKSLTLRIAHGLLSPTSGEVRWLGEDVSGAPATDDSVRRHQAMVFERPVLLRRSAAANIAHGLALHRVPRAERAKRIADVLEKTGLSELAKRSARVLSAGDRQRLALARAWALEPAVLFLDEPTAALDPSATRTVEALIDSIAASGTKVVMTTHDLSQARRLADDVLFLCSGRVVEHTDAERFFSSPESEEARSFLRGDLVW